MGEQGGMCVDVGEVEMGGQVNDCQKTEVNSEAAADQAVVDEWEQVGQEQPEEEGLWVMG